uniref:Glucose-6-phosphate isomerase n=1 Tax=uncultured bacterium A1Q1_fos_962 TaxID=1256592 RepID=L7VSU0_9BACT|nr:glucose-6-phosphate isomerase [uncultured bacterium A1Q1_fos_962]
MTHAPIAPLRYDFEKTLLDDRGITAEGLRRLGLDLERARREILDVDLPLFEQQQAVPAAKEPLDAGFIGMPERLLREYGANREKSELGQILATARRLQETVDRVVVLGIGGSYMGAKAMMDACCHPYHNELNRGQRGSRPRVYFDGNNLDNDATQALLDLLPSEGNSQKPEDRWALIVISKSGGTLETAAAFRIYLEALQKAEGRQSSVVAQQVIPITGETGKLRNLANALGCPVSFPVPDGVGGRFSVFSAVGLLPAAVLGIDIVRLLQGAAAMNEHFRTAPVESNIVLNYTGVNHLMERERGATIRILSVWSKALECVGLWYDQLLAESLGKAELGAMPLTVVNTRDLHSRAQQHQEGRRDKMINNLIIDHWRRDALALQESKLDHDGLNTMAGKTLPEMMSAAIQGTNQAYLSDHRPTANLHLPGADEGSLGQLLQMLMLATVVEGRLLGINPYGQPGVEAYKRFMKQQLDAR